MLDCCTTPGTRREGASLHKVQSGVCVWTKFACEPSPHMYDVVKYSCYTRTPRDTMKPMVIRSFELDNGVRSTSCMLRILGTKARHSVAVIPRYGSTA